MLISNIVSFIFKSCSWCFFIFSIAIFMTLMFILKYLSIEHIYNTFVYELYHLYHFCLCFYWLIFLLVGRNIFLFLHKSVLFLLDAGNYKFHIFYCFSLFLLYVRFCPEIYYWISGLSFFFLFLMSFWGLIFMVLFERKGVGPEEFLSQG